MRHTKEYCFSEQGTKHIKEACQGQEGPAQSWRTNASANKSALPFPWDSESQSQYYG